MSASRAIAALIVSLAISALLAYWTRPRLPDYDWSLPDGFPVPSVPLGNAMTRQKVALGRWLFYDKRLSVNGSTACASCHIQALAFTDGRPRAIGATGEQHPRGAMSLVNVAYNSTFDWANPNVIALEVQMLRPLFGEEPIEMGLSGHSKRVLAELGEDRRYRQLFARAFPGADDPFIWQNVVYSIASFVRTIVSAGAPYDDYIRGDTEALVASAVRGLELFLSERLECFHCHGGFNFTDSSTHDRINDPPRQFHNTGLYNIAGTGAYPAPNTGVHALTSNPDDMGRFRAPTLRNITLTAPYMHDGTIATLDAVIDHYANGGRKLSGSELAGDGHENPLKSEFVNGFALSVSERRDLLAFLEALTDESVRENPQWSDPFQAMPNND